MRFYLIIITILISNLESKEILALLNGIENNHTLHMKHKQIPFVCKPYGIQTVSELINSTDMNSSCKKHIQEFRLANPKEKYFAKSLLHVYQQYNVEGIKGLCMLNISSGYSYSELLLEHGYARITPNQLYKDVLIKHRFDKAVKRAKKKSAGIWSDINVRNCFLNFKKK